MLRVSTASLRQELWIQWSCGVHGLYGEFAAEALHTVVVWRWVPTASLWQSCGYSGLVALTVSTASLRQKLCTRGLVALGPYGEFVAAALDMVVFGKG